MSFDRNPQSLWRAVLIQAVRDAAGIGALAKKRGRPEASRISAWVRTTDFRLVCLWAGIDDVLVKRTIDNLVASPDARADLKHALIYVGNGAYARTARQPAQKDTVT